MSSSSPYAVAPTRNRVGTTRNERRRRTEHKRSLIREQRTTTILDPDLMAAHRPTAIAISRANGNPERAGERTFHERPECLRGPERPLELREDKTLCRETLYRRVPGLSPARREDERAYADACRSRRVWTLVTMGVRADRWVCRRRVSSGRKGICDTVNKDEGKPCRSCRAAKPDMAPWFWYLRRVATAMKQEREYLLGQMRTCDENVSRCEKRLAELTEIDAKGDNDDEHDEGLPAHDESVHNQRSFNSSSSPCSDNVDLERPGGLWQRVVDAKSTVPILIADRRHSEQRLAQARGRLCVIVQIVYELAVGHCQRTVRGHAVRVKRPYYERLKEETVRCAAAVMVQCRVRVALARRSRNRRRAARELSSCVRLQCFARRVAARRFLHRLRYALRIWNARRILPDMAERRRLWMEARKRARRAAEAEARAAAERARVLALRNRAATTIQSRVRTYVAGRIVKERRIRLCLNDRLMNLVDRYMTSGDLWTLLEKVDEDYRRFEGTIHGILETEEHMAAAFVRKVRIFLCKEALSFDPFGCLVSLMTVGCPLLALVNSEVVQVREREHVEAWAKYDRLVDETTKESTAATKRFGEVARKWIADNNTETSKDVDVAGQQCIHRYAMYQNSSNKRRCHDNKLSLLDKTNRSVKKTATKTREVERQPLEKAKDEETKEEQSISNTLPPTRRPCRPLPAAYFSGSHVCRDVPGGLDDTVDRFLRAASVRYRSKSNERRYSDLPPGLAKVRLEHSAWASTKRVMERLHALGVRTVRQLLPTTNAVSLLRSCLVEREDDDVDDDEKTMDDDDVTAFVDTCKRLLTDLVTFERSDRFTFARDRYRELKTKGLLSLDDNNGSRRNDDHADDDRSDLWAKVADHASFDASDVASFPKGLWADQNDDDIEGSRRRDQENSDNGTDKAMPGIENRRVIDTDEVYRQNVPSAVAGNEATLLFEAQTSTEFVRRIHKLNRSELERLTEDRNIRDRSPALPASEEGEEANAPITSESACRARDELRAELERIINGHLQHNRGDDDCGYQGRCDDKSLPIWDGGLFQRNETSAGESSDQQRKTSKRAMKSSRLSKKSGKRSIHPQKSNRGQKGGKPKSNVASRNSCWVIPYAERILSEAKVKYPAYQQLRCEHQFVYST